MFLSNSFNPHFKTNDVKHHICDFTHIYIHTKVKEMHIFFHVYLYVYDFNIWVWLKVHCVEQLAYIKYDIYVSDSIPCMITWLWESETLPQTEAFIFTEAGGYFFIIKYNKKYNPGFSVWL